MANTTVNSPANPAARRRAHGRHNRLEYCFYVALIFMLALPFAVTAWLLSRANADGPQTHSGPIAWALAESRLMASMVFRA